MDWTPNRPPKLYGRFEAAGPGDLPASVGDARRAFLAAVRERVPAVLDDLAAEPFDCALAASQDGPGDIWRWSDIERRAHGDPHFARLRDALDAWAKHFHLDMPWCLDIAARTLALWCLAPSVADERQWFEPASGRRVPFADEQLAFTVTLAGWRPDTERRGEAAIRLREAFGAALVAHLDSVERMAAERGLNRAPEHRGAPHLQWLALYQCGGWSQGRIVRKFCVQRETVRDGLRSAAELIELPLRPPGRPGRPPTKA